MKNRRKHFLINKPLQLRYMFYLVFTLLIVLSTAGFGLYFGIWGEVLNAFTDKQFQSDLITAARLTQYEDVRTGTSTETPSTLTVFRQAEKLNDRQREIFNQILKDTNRRLLPKFLLLLFFIGWGTIFISHKIAGPFYRLQKAFESMGKGDVSTRIHLRKYDEARYIVDYFNTAVSYLDSVFIRLKKITGTKDTDAASRNAQIQEELSKIKTSAD